MSEKFMTTEEVCAELRIAKRTLYSWRLRGLGPPAVKIGKHLKFRRAAYELWLEHHQGADHTPTPVVAYDEPTLFEVKG